MHWLMTKGAAAKDPDTSIVIPKKQDLPKIKRRAKVAQVFEVYEGDTLSKIVLPVHGKGLWGTMYGLLALEADANTVVGIGFYEHKETPGLGGEIENPKWKAQFEGKKVYDEGFPQLL